MKRCIENKKKLFILFFLFLSNIFLVQNVSGKESVGICNDAEYTTRIYDLWNSRKVHYYKWINGKGYNSDGLQRSHPYELYDIQKETNNLLRYSDYCQDSYILEELLALYVRALDTLVETNQYLVYNYPVGQRSSILNLTESHKMWLKPLKSSSYESIGVSAQFLFLVSEAFAIVTRMEETARTPSPSILAFIRKFTPVLLDHYKRWLFNKPGPFQVRGWGCKVNGKYVPGGMNHSELIVKKLNRKLGDEKSPSYCNAVIDSDMFIIAGVSNLLAAHKLNNHLVSILPQDYDKLNAYVEAGVALLQSRISHTKQTNFIGKSVDCANFDLGSWDDHPDYSYATYSGKNYPLYNVSSDSITDTTGFGWDLSHASRFVHVFETLFRNKEILNLQFPSDWLVEELANQFVYNVFNGNFVKPLFSNFMDGSNGWYRVSYSSRKGFGYGPSGLSIAALTGGYGFWSKYEKDIGTLFCSLFEMVSSNSPKIKEHVMEHYETNRWGDFKRLRRFDLSDHENPMSQSVLIQFLPSLCQLKGYKRCNDVN